MKKLLFAFLLSLFSHTILAQNDSCYNLLLVHKNFAVDSSKIYNGFSPKSFFLIRNTVYDFALKGKQKICGKLIDIKADTIVITNYFSENIAKAHSAIFDTLHIAFSNLDSLLLLKSTNPYSFKKYAFSDYNFNLKKEKKCLHASSYNFSGRGEQFRYETYQGSIWVIEEKGNAKIQLLDSLDDHAITSRYVMWASPSPVDRIYGLCISAWASNTKKATYDYRPTLRINGVNIEINPFAAFILIREPSFTLKNFERMVKEYENDSCNSETTVNGINLSGLGSMQAMKVTGINIGGVSTLINEINGLSISGINNSVYHFNGLSLAVFGNRVYKMRGVQIGLFNRAYDLRGFQFGLWNTNGKRSLPFINWQFSESKKK